MPTMDYWASPPMVREQMALFAPTLEATIAPDDPVRLFDEVLSGLDWSAWEAQYHGPRGQPPIHPRVVAAAWLYGMCRGIRSSRKLEEACAYRLDFVWLVEGRRLDHTTLAKFRVRFAQPLKGLFRQVCRIAMSVGLIRLGEVGFDGTRARASNSRYKTRTAKSLEVKLQELEAKFETMLAEAEAADRPATSEGAEDSPTHLPPALADLDQRRQRVREALAKARAADEARKRQGVDPRKNPAQVCLTDPDAKVMPNKEGGYAPNYTPTAMTDGQCGFIVDADVLAEVNESPALLPGIKRIEEICGRAPEKLLTDSGNNAGPILQALEDKGIEAYAPVESSLPQGDNPACRADPTQPVPESDWPRLPRNAHQRLAKSCFVYQPEQDHYYCPRGKVMPFEKSKSDERCGEQVSRRVYRCADCVGCPLAAMCLDPQARYGRTITRDAHDVVRETVAARMASDEGRKVYNQRPRIAETPFAILKAVMGLRQFLLRGLEKVKTEWNWGVTAFNVGKLVRHMARLRAEFALLSQEAST
jgi:transposase